MCERASQRTECGGAAEVGADGDLVSHGAGHDEHGGFVAGELRAMWASRSLVVGSSRKTSSIRVVFSMALSMDAVGVVMVSERKSRLAGPGCCHALILCAPLVPLGMASDSPFAVVIFATCLMVCGLR